MMPGTEMPAPEIEAVPGGERLFEVNDPEINLDQIMLEIRERIQQRRQELGLDNRRFPSFGAAAYPGEPDDIPYDPMLYHHLRLANDLYGSAPAGTHLSASPATRLPLVGRFWQLIRVQAHALVLFYVNRHVAHQSNVDRHLVSVLNRLATVTAEQQREIQALRAALETLRAGGAR